ncbi:MAG: flagellin lysine-N-methylase [Oscillospiraceae bacterium]|nr:flagellin lysine-N-methylase [Oscillospiraceae bacterium]
MKEDKLFTPAYFESFHCLMGACPDSCCKAGWEIPIDDETIAKLRTYPKLEIDKNICPGSDGDTVLRVNDNEICPYLTHDGLCEMYIQSGMMGDVCSKHPRFYEEYYTGDEIAFTEAGISVSCPEAARIVLSASRSDYDSLSKVQTDDDLLNFLLSAREKAFDIPSSQLIAYGELLQEEIDFCTFELPGHELTDSEPIDMPSLCDFILTKTEILTPEWRKLLESCGQGSFGNIPKPQKQALLWYLIFRFFLKAVNTEDILTECKLIVALYELCISLSEINGDFTETVRLASKELEHDDFNLDLLRDYLSQS